MEQISYLSQSVWLSIPSETRAKLVTLFEFPEKGSVQTMYGPNGPEVISDGYGYDHLKLITLGKMNEILGIETNDFYAAFNLLITHIDKPEEVVVIEEIVLEEVTTNEQTHVEPKKHKTKAK